MLNRRFLAVAAMAALSLGAAAQAPTSLKQAFHNDFLIGAAIDAPEITGQDSQADAIITTQFDTITPANALKWERIHPKPGVYNFTLADKYVAFGEKHHMFIVGHCLVWHNQVPGWVFRDSKGNFVDRKTLLKRMHDHIFTVVGRYKGRIQSWDVVNEAVNDDGTLRQTPWLKIIGPDYIEKAFQYAHEADPKAQLNYNDYSLAIPAKRKTVIALVEKLKSEGIPVATVGMQNHDKLDWPSDAAMDAAISDFEKIGVKVGISELDIDVLPPATQNQGADVSLKIAQNPKLNPYAKGLPLAVQKELAQRYAGLFRVFLKHRGEITRVTFWGVTNKDSWLNDWPVVGRTSYPLLFGRNGQPNLAYKAVLQTAEAKQ